MPADATKIARFCDLLTNNKAIKDFPGAENGLQHKGRAKVRKVGCAVDAGAKVFEMAAVKGGHEVAAQRPQHFDFLPVA